MKAPVLYHGKKPDPVDVRAGANLRALRCWRGLSQKNLADALGLTFQQIQKYESGRNRISVSIMYQMSKALDVSIMEFFGGIGGTPKENFSIQLSAEERKFLSAYRDIQDHHKRRRVIELVQILADGTLKN